MGFSRYYGTGDNFVINSHDEYGSGTQTLYFDSSTDEGYGWINLSSNYSYIDSVTFIIDWVHSDNSANGLTFQLYDDDFNVCEFRLYSNTNKVEYYDVVEEWTAISPTNSFPTGYTYYLKLVISHVSGNTMNYSLYNYSNDDEFLYGVDGYSHVTSTWTNFKNIHIMKDSVAPADDSYYLDDIVIDTTPQSGEDPSGGETGYNYIGNEEFIYYISSESGYISSYTEFKYHVPVTADFHVLDIYLHLGLISVFKTFLEAGGYENIEACLNNNSLGTADQFFTTGIAQNTYHTFTTGSEGTPAYIGVLRFEFNTVTLTNEQPIISIYLPTEILDAFNVKFFTGGIGNDLDGDGIALYKSHGNAGYYCNKIFNGIDRNADICYNLYYDSFTPPTVESFSDTDHISVYGYISPEHETYNIPYYYKYQNVIITYTISTLVPDTYLHVYREGTKLDEQGYPIRLDEYGRSYGFIPSETGFYNASLYRSGERILNASFYVIENPFNYWIWTSPNPSINRNQYWIGYKYYNENGYEGLLAIYNDLGDFNTGITSAKQTFILESNETVNFSYLPSSDQQYMQIYVNRSGILQPVGSSHLHLCINQFYENGEIYAGYDPVKVSIETPILQIISEETLGFFQNLYGFHSFLFSEVRITINDYPKFDVSTEQNFSFLFFPESTGLKIAKLQVRINNTWVELDRCYYNVTQVGPIEEEGNFLDLFENLDPIIKAIAGTFIILFFTLLPILITLGYKGSISSIPPLVYLITSGVGITFAVALGLVSIWVPFFIIALGIIVTILFYIRGMP